jgi:hypothetical protein
MWAGEEKGQSEKIYNATIIALGSVQVIQAMKVKISHFLADI